MFYTYESGGRVSRPISDYRSEVLSGSFVARGLESFKFNQGPAVPLSDIGGTLAQYADRSIYNTQSYRSGLGILSGAQTSQQDVPEGYVYHQSGPIYTWTTDEFGGDLDPQSNRVLVPRPSRFLLLNNAEESKSYSYHPALIDLYTEVDYGLVTANATSTSNNGLVADLNATQVEYGRIWYVTTVESFGLRKVIGAAQARATNAWVGEGRLVSFGRQTSPAVYGWITDGKVRSFTVHGTADVDWSPAPKGRGFIPLQGNSKVVFTPNWVGSGTLRKFSGYSESISVNPDERQMLFSFVGELVERQTDHYHGSGSLRNFSSAKEEKSFDWVGSGTINIRSDKPDQFTLEELANRKLEDIKDVWLGAFKYEPSDEKHTESYNDSSIVVFTERDYGILSVCTTTENINGDVSGQATGCIVKVDTTARVVSGQTYQVAAAQSAASTVIDWGVITVPASMQQNWGNILDTSDLTPHGSFSLDNGSADKFLPTWTSRGYISKLRGEAKLPLFASVFSEGSIGKITGAGITNFSLLQPGDGLFKFHSKSTLAVTLGIIGSGGFKKLSGAAESLTANPDEHQILFSFSGGITTEKHTESYIGSGRIRNLATLEAEKGTFDYVGSGGIELRSVKPELTEPSEEKHTECYNSTAFIPSVDLDYGQIIDTTLSQVTTLGTQTIASNTNAPSGAIRVDQNAVVTLNATYSIPPQYTTPSSTLNYGLVAENYDPLIDHGWILGTTDHGTPYGDITIGGTVKAPQSKTYEASVEGLFRITGEARLPLFASHTTQGLYRVQGASITNFSLLAPGDGQIRGLEGTSPIAFVPNWVGSGSIRKIGGAAESSSWNPLEKQMLFSFIGGYEDLSFTYGAWIGSGSIKNLSTRRAEKSTYDWVGDGEITIRSDKPDQFTLEELADTQLFEIKNIILSDLKYEPSDEKHTEVYNDSAFVEFLDLDYGSLVDLSNTVLTPLPTQTIGTSIAPTGVVRVDQNAVVTLTGTYTVPSTQTIPSTFIDYNIVDETEDELLDLGHILDTVAMGQPYGEIHISGTAEDIFFPNLTGSGLYKIGGSSDTPRARVYDGSGNLFAINGAGETVTNTVVGEGLFNIGGSSPYAASLGVIGEGTLSTLLGAAESLTANPDEHQMLFSFLGTSEPYNLRFSEFGSGTLFSYTGTAVRDLHAWYGSGTIKLRTRIPEPTEPANEKHTEVYDLNVCYDPPEINYGLLVDASLASCVPVSGSITSNTVATTGCTNVPTTLSVAPGVTYTVPTLVSAPTETYDYGFVYDPPDQYLDYGWILDDTGKECPFGPISILRGSSGPAIRTYSEVSSGESAHWSGHGIIITGEAEIVVPPQWDSPAEPPVKVYGASKTGFSLRTFGKGRIWNFAGGSECVRYSPDEEQLLFKIVPGPLGRWDHYDWQPSWVTRGFIRGAIGEAKTHWVPNVISTGSLKGLSGGAESISYSPDFDQDWVYVCVDEEGTISTSTVATSGCVKAKLGSTLEIEPGVYYQVPLTGGVLRGIEEKSIGQIVGEAEESFTANPPEDTARVVFTGDAWPTRYIPHWTGSGTIPITGIAKTHWVPHVIGTGYIPVFAGAAESLTFNPEERQMLFSFIGERLSEKKSVAEVGFGTLLVTGESSQVLTFSEQPFGRIPVSGIGHTTRTRPFIGSGSIRKLGGSAESTTFNPTERQMLFSFIGERIAEKRTSAESGSGVLFGFGGAAVTSSTSYETQGLYKIYGESIIGFSLTHFGSGTLRKLGGAAESLTVNPDERQLLFSFTGAGSERVGVAETKQIEIDITGRAHPVLTTQAFHGSGTFNLSGESRVRWVPNNIGSGTIFTLAGGAESLTFNPEEKQMLFSFIGEGSYRTTVKEISKGGIFKFSGTSGDPKLTFAEQPYVQTRLSGEVVFTVHRRIFGTGSLYTINGAAEAVAFNPEERQILFSVTGESSNKLTKDYIGSGSLRKLGGSAESVSYNPDEQQMLFSFNGAGTEKRTSREIGTGRLSTTGEAGVLVRFAHTGEGTIPLSGSAHTTRARDFVGFGTVPTFSGAAESLTFNPTERDMLFSFAGERISEARTSRELSKGGTLAVRSTSGDPLLTFAEQPRIEVAISGDSYDLRAFAYAGSGRISNVNNLDEAFALAPYIGSGTARIFGQALIQVVVWQPPSVQVWII